MQITFVIASGSNLNQVQAMVDNVEEQLGRAGYEPKQGGRNKRFQLDPYGLWRSHHPCVLMKKNRLFYDLERESGEMEKKWDAEEFP